MATVSSYRGYTIRIPSTGGKAGRGRNKTGTVQVLEDRGYVRSLIASFRFVVGKPGSKLAAWDKAHDYVNRVHPMGG